METEKISNKENKLSLLVQLRNFGIGPIIGMGISMLTVPVATRILSPEEYGKSSLFTLFQSLFLIIGLLGIDQGYVRYYNNKEIDKNNLFINCLYLPMAFAFILIIICLFFTNTISTFLFGSVEKGLMIAFCCFIPVLLLNRFFLLQIRMSLRGKTYSLLNITSQIINFLTLLLFLFFYEKTFRSIVYSTIIGMIINTFIIFLFCDKSFLKSSFSFSKKLQIDLLRFSLPLVPASLLSWLLNSFDKVGLRSWSSFEELGLYAAAFKIVALLNVFQSIFSTAWIPVAYKWYEDKVPNKKFEQVSTIVLAVMVCLFSFIVVFRDVIMLFLGSEFRNTSKIFVFLLFVPVMYTVSETTSLGIGFSKKTMYSLYVSIIAVILNIVGNYFLIPVYGAEGAAISTCISYIVFFWCRTLFSRHIWFKFKLGKYFLDIMLLLLFGINMIYFNNKIIEISIFVIIVVFNGFLLYKLYKEKKEVKYDII